MIGLIVKIRALAGQGDAFVAAFREQAAHVRTDEPGNHLYELMRSREDPDQFLAVEIYNDKDAIQAHREAPHMVANRPRIAPLIDGEPSFEIWRPVEH